MKNLRLAFVCALLIFAASSAFSQARVQFVHNSADESATLVDIWVDQALAFEDLSFRKASPFLDITAGQQITVAVTAPNSPLLWLVVPLAVWQIAGVVWRSRAGWKQPALLSGGAVLLAGLAPALWLISVMIGLTL